MDGVACETVFQEFLENMLGVLRWLFGLDEAPAPAQAASRYYAGRLYIHQADDTFYVDANHARLSQDGESGTAAI